MKGNPQILKKDQLLTSISEAVGKQVELRREGRGARPTAQEDGRGRSPRRGRRGVLDRRSRRGRRRRGTCSSPGPERVEERRRDLHTASTSTASADAAAHGRPPPADRHAPLRLRGVPAPQGVRGAPLGEAPVEDVGALRELPRFFGGGRGRGVSGRKTLAVHLVVVVACRGRCFSLVAAAAASSAQSFGQGHERREPRPRRGQPLGRRESLRRRRGRGRGGALDQRARRGQGGAAPGCDAGAVREVGLDRVAVGVGDAELVRGWVGVKAEAERRRRKRRGKKNAMASVDRFDVVFFISSLCLFSLRDHPVPKPHLDVSKGSSQTSAT